ncbi:MAG: DUF87 domain-containing protein [Sphingomonas sp.]
MTAEIAHLPVAPAPTRVPIGRLSTGDLMLDLDKLMAGRCLIQGSSGAGKSQTLRKIIEETFDFLTVMIVDPEGEFHNLAAHIGATTLRAADLASDGLTAAATRARHHRLPLHLDLTDLDPEQRIVKAAAFFAGLIGSPREDWTNTVLVAVDEAHLLAPHMAASARDAETRRLGVATLTDLCARGRKRGIGSVIATQRLAKLNASVVSELHNVLIGLNVFDRDVKRAADLLGFDAGRAEMLMRLAPGEFYALGPALAPIGVLAKVAPTITSHTGSTPDLIASACVSAEEARVALDLDALERAGADHGSTVAKRGGVRALDAFLMEPAAATAVRIIEALRRIAPNATTSADLAKHLGVDQSAADDALDLLGAIGAADTMPRGDTRIARLTARLRLREIDTPVVGLA